MKIDCPWEGCDGVIDLSKEFRHWPRKGRTPFLLHTIVCPKCHNIVGTMNLGAEWWVDSTGKKKTINDLKTGKEIVIKRRSELEKRLKEWARNDYPKK